MRTTPLRTLISMILVLTGILTLAAPAGALPPRMSPDNPEIPGVPTELPDDDDPPVAPAVAIRRPRLGADDTHELLSRSFDVTIVDRSDHERGTRLQRRRDSGRWVTVTSRHVLDGNYVHQERNLVPDTRYCYRAVAHNFAGASASPVQCAVTRAEEPQPVARIQLEITTADLDGAGTGEKRTLASLAPGNGTWLDLPGDDFGRGTTRSFDLLPAGIADLTDIEHLRLSGGANDPWCVDEVRLNVNGSRVFRDSFDAEPDGCRWFGNGRSTVMKVAHRALRDHPQWSHQRPRGVFFDPTEVIVIISASQLKSRLDGLIGHALHDQDARWRGDGVTVARSAVRSDYLRVNVPLSAATWEAPFGGKIDLVDVDVDFDLFPSMNQPQPGQDVRLNIEPRNVRASLPDWLTWAGRIFDLGPCGPVASAVKGQGIPGCFAAIERSLQRQIQSGIGAARVNTTLNSGDGCCRSLDIEILEDGAVHLTIGFILPPASLEAPPNQSSQPATSRRPRSPRHLPRRIPPQPAPCAWSGTRRAAALGRGCNTSVEQPLTASRPEPPRLRPAELRPRVGDTCVAGTDAGLDAETCMSVPRFPANVDGLQRHTSEHNIGALAEVVTSCSSRPRATSRTLR